MFPFFLAAAIATAGPSQAPTPTPLRLLGFIRAKFRSHRPPPPYVSYTLERKQLTDQGYPDYVNSYKEHIWVRSSDRAALARRVYRSINRGDPMFERPAFNEDRDPGPPTADVFEAAPLHSHPISFVPTPEPAPVPESTDLRVIDIVRAVGEFDYRVTSLETVGDQYHMFVEPTRDPDRNRLREIWADRKTLELKKLVATDKLFDGLGKNAPVYGVTFTITIGNLDGIPVVTAIHGIVGDGYTGDGSVVDYTFTDIAFPQTLPAWYFDESTYKAHTNDLPL